MPCKIQNATDAPTRRMVGKLDKLNFRKIGEALPDCLEVGVERTQGIAHKRFLSVEIPLVIGEVEQSNRQ
jgi:hypothetical protein